MLITAHTNAAIAKVNAEALQTYWEVGAYISYRLKNAQWGNHVVSELADYLKRHNPKRRGYGKRSLYNMVKLFIENVRKHLPDDEEAEAEETAPATNTEE